MKFIKKIISSMLYIKKLMVFESVPDMSDNTKAVFDEMLKRGLNKKYKMVWLVKADFKTKEKYKNVSYLKPTAKFFGYRKRLLLHRAKLLVSCNGFLTSKRAGQLSIYLAHGMPLKSVRGYYTLPKGIDYCLSTSTEMNGIVSREFNFDAEKIVSLGYPRNDLLVRTTGSNVGLFDGEFSKVVVWYPTFRQHKAGLVAGGSNALPIIYDYKSAQRLNEVAKSNGVLVVIKPHFAQDTSYIRELNLSNIRFIDDGFFGECGLKPYEFIARCDALITDYSSIYYDFLLCDKPIALVWEDIEEYKKNPGLIDNYEYYAKGAEKIYCIDELETFIANLTNGKDSAKEQREEIKAIVNEFADDKSSERVVDFILDKIRK